MIKKGILENQEGRTTERAKMWVYTINYPSHKFYKSYLIIEIKVVTSSDSQDRGI